MNSLRSFDIFPSLRMCAAALFSTGQRFVSGDFGRRRSIAGRRAYGVPFRLPPQGRSFFEGMGQTDRVGRGDTSINVRSTSNTDRIDASQRTALRAISRHMQCSKQHRYSITSSVRVTSVGGSVIPSAFAVFKLMTSSNFVGCCTGRSAGFSPLRIRPA